MLKRIIPVFIMTVILGLMLTAGALLTENKRDNRIIDGEKLDILVRNEADIIRLAKFFGADKKPLATDCEEVVIPNYFNGLYEKYNELQSPLGIDLAGFKGQKCLKYRLHFPEEGGFGKVMTLLVCNGSFIGGDMSDELFDGAMISLYDNRTK